MTGKPRPAVIVQSELFAELETIVVCPLTTEGAETLTRLSLQPSEALPLTSACWVAVDKISTIRRRRVGQVIGTLKPADLQRVNGALLLVLGVGQ